MTVARSRIDLSAKTDENRPVMRLEAQEQLLDKTDKIQKKRVKLMSHLLRSAKLFVQPCGS